MLYQFLFSNIHFALTIFGALVFFAAGWLHFDSWKLDKKHKTTIARSTGFFLVAAAYGIHATTIQAPLFLVILAVCKTLGLLIILLSLFLEPLIHKPGDSQNTPKQNSAFFPLGIATTVFSVLSAVLMLFVSFAYLLKSTKGSEKQLRPVFYAFLLFAISEFISFSFFFKNTSVVFWSKLLSDYALFWNIAHVFELLGFIILGTWVYGYTRFRLNVQLFFITITSFLFIFLVTTFIFTYSLLKNLENDTLSNLKTNVNVLQYALNGLKQQALTSARAVSGDSNIYEAVIQRDSDRLYALTSQFLITHNTNFLAVTSSTGEVLMRAENRDKIGDTLANDPLVQNALNNNSLSTVVTTPGILAPVVRVEAAVPIPNRNATDAARLVGTIVTGFLVDNTFVDGVKTLTGLETSVFGDNTRAATTFLDPDGKSRSIGTKETNPKVLEKVLKENAVYAGPSQILNQPYYSVYSPLKTVNDATIGMLYVGKPQTTILETAQKSIQFTFLGSVILMTLSLIPAYFLSSFIQKQIEA